MRAISFLWIIAAVFFAAYVASQPATVEPAKENNEQEFMKLGYTQKESMQIFSEKFRLFASSTPDCGANLSQKQIATKLWCENPK